MRKLRMYDHVITPEGPGYIVGAGRFDGRPGIRIIPLKKATGPYALIAVRFPQRRHDFEWFWRKEIEHAPRW